MTAALLLGSRASFTLSSGEKIYPDEIEGLYSSFAPVKEMCVFIVSGMRGVQRSKLLWAIIQPDLELFREFGEVNLRDVLKERFDNAAQTLPLYKRLKGFTIALEDLPHNIFGKLQRSAVKKIYEPRVIEGIEGALPVTGQLSADDKTLLLSEVGQKIFQCLQGQSRINRPITLEDSLELDLGIDSLGRIELGSALEEVFKAEIDVEAVARAFSVRRLIQEMTEALKKADIIPLWDQRASLGPHYWKDHLAVSPEKETLALLELSTGFFAWLFRIILTGIDCLIFKVFFDIKAEGEENVPKEGAYILYGNHTSFLDGPAIAACLPRRPVFQLFYFVFGPYFFRPFVRNPVLRNLIKMGRFIPFDFSTHFLEALRSSFYVLQHGKGLCFFPEGLRTASGEIAEFKKGFGVLAKETGAMLVPVAIKGAHTAWPSTARYPRCGPIRLKFGKPLNVEGLERQGLAMGAADSYEAICMSARKALIRLKSEVDISESESFKASVDIGKVSL
ncbi:MAG: 1-acyl-sn-glycerol-3-phosphate acyltransferase [Candidatus Omnitrophica bacterium]|nr:1-acyl-sn-glycerol-3-phosphate acyltransferase [Candidatus Omnitrophota bacterium]